MANEYRIIRIALDATQTDQEISVNAMRLKVGRMDGPITVKLDGGDPIRLDRPGRIIACEPVQLLQVTIDAAEVIDGGLVEIFASNNVALDFEQAGSAYDAANPAPILLCHGMPCVGAAAGTLWDLVNQLTGLHSTTGFNAPIISVGGHEDQGMECTRIYAEPAIGHRGGYSAMQKVSAGLMTLLERDVPGFPKNRVRFGRVTMRDTVWGRLLAPGPQTVGNRGAVDWGWCGFALYSVWGAFFRVGYNGNWYARIAAYDQGSGAIDPFEIHVDTGIAAVTKPRILEIQCEGNAAGLPVVRWIIDNSIVHEWTGPMSIAAPGGGKAVGTFGTPVQVAPRWGAVHERGNSLDYAEIRCGIGGGLEVWYYPPELIL